MSQPPLWSVRANGDASQQTTLEDVRELVVDLGDRMTRMQEHFLETRQLMRVATFPSRLPLWFIAGALCVIALALVALIPILLWAR